VARLPHLGGYAVGKAKEGRAMRTYLVFSLDSLLPVAVGEHVGPEAARAAASNTTGIPYNNLIAEEVNLCPHIPTLDEWLKDDSK